ncbi:hypothetical protein C2857_000226 [Epichloe festucae Fl1]|uniref:Uncharacterized protein n=1 Tax=Epichloe festucae (strain Fl1) TaxID=877507 RepID=A0A7S9KR62_EPIFF|nr:hypothetical protein C2857_000226 [Epichloe festucae Fl1]
MAREHAPPAAAAAAAAAEPVSPASSASSASREPSPPPSAQAPYGLYPPCQNAGPPPHPHPHPHPHPPARRPLVQKIKSMSRAILHLLVLVVALIGIGFAIALLVKGAKSDHLWRGGVDDDWFDKRWGGGHRHGHGHGHEHGRHGHDRDLDRDHDRDRDLDRGRDHHRGPGRDGDFRHDGGYGHDREYYGPSLSSAVIFVLSLLWSLADLVVRRLLKWKAGFHPIAHASVSLCLWIASTSVGVLMSLSVSRQGGYFGGGVGGRRCDPYPYPYHRYDAGSGSDTASLRDGLRAGRRLRHGHRGGCRHSAAAQSPLFLGTTVLILIAALVELAIFVFACIDLWARRKAARRPPPPPPAFCVPPVACVPVQPVCASV